MPDVFDPGHLAFLIGVATVLAYLVGSEVLDSEHAPVLVRDDTPQRDPDAGER